MKTPKLISYLTPNNGWLTRSAKCSLFVLSEKFAEFGAYMSRDDELRAYFDKQIEEFDDAVRQALVIADGDAMAAIRTLVIANMFLNEENDRLREQISAGYMRGQTKKAAS
jgi:hypothetical protein